MAREMRGASARGCTLGLVVVAGLLLAGGEARADVPVTLVGQWGGPSFAAAVVGNRAYVGSGPRLLIFDVSNPSAPLLLGRSEVLPGVVRGVAVAGSYAYVADDDAGLQVINIANPASPVRVGGYDTSGRAYDVAVAGSYAYVADGAAGLQVINIANPASPVRVGGYDTSGRAYDVAVAGSYAYVADYDGGLVILRIGGAPSVLTVMSTSADGVYTLGDVVDVTVRFNQSVNVTGVPQLVLETGAIDRSAPYFSGSGTDAIHFRYVVQSGDVSADLDYRDPAALLLNGGSIRSVADNSNADLTLPMPGTPNSLSWNRNIMVDTLSQPEPGGDLPPEQIQLNRLWRFDPASGRFVAPTGSLALNISQPTYVLAHGWDGDLNLKRSMSSIACAIHAARPAANILAWEWSAGANPDGNPDTISYGLTVAAISLLTNQGWAAALAVGGIWLDAFLSGTYAKTEGLVLAAALKSLGDTHGGSLGSSVHLIGHSHGGAVVGMAAQRLSALGRPATSLTTLDTPKVCAYRLCLINSVEAIVPSATVSGHAALFYYPLTCVGVGAPKAGATNVRLNCDYVPGGLLQCAHTWISGPDGNASCPADDGWYPVGIWDAAGGHAGSVTFPAPTGSVSLLDPTAFPAGLFGELGQYQFVAGAVLEEERDGEGDETAGLRLLEQETFDTATAWSGTNAIRVTGADPLNPGNSVMVLRENGDASFFRDVSWPCDSLLLTFEYRFTEPRGDESLTVYVNNAIAYYESAATVPAGDVFTVSTPIYVGNVAGTTARLNFVLRTDGVAGGAVQLDNVRIFALPLGDMNCDGQVTFDDIEPFVLALSGQAAYEAAFPSCAWLNADCNRDGQVNLEDIDGFVECLGGRCGCE